MYRWNVLMNDIFFGGWVWVPILETAHLFLSSSNPEFPGFKTNVRKGLGFRDKTWVKISWVVEPPSWKIYASQIGSFPQVGVKIENVWKHHLAMYTACFITTGGTQLNHCWSSQVASWMGQLALPKGKWWGIHTRWAPRRFFGNGMTWGPLKMTEVINGFHWGYFNPISGVITLLITGRGPTL